MVEIAIILFQFRSSLNETFNHFFRKRLVRNVKRIGFQELDFFVQSSKCLDPIGNDKNGIVALHKKLFTFDFDQKLFDDLKDVQCTLGLLKYCRFPEKVFKQFRLEVLDKWFQLLNRQIFYRLFPDFRLL